VSALRIGEILIAEGVLTEAAVNRALGYQRVSGERVKLGTILLNWDLLAEQGLLQALARFHRVEAAPWSVLSAAPIPVTRLISPAMAIRLGAFPFAETKTAIHVAFVEPSNLAAADEVSAVTNKRVIPAVALEIRLLQAHQKFYGRHIPLEYRTIVQKLERRTTKTSLPDWQKTVDFRLPDLAEAEKTAGPPVPPPPPGIRNPPMDLRRAPLEHGPTRPGSTPIRVSRGLADTELDRDSIPSIEIPEMPKLKPIPAADRFSDTNPLSASAVARERSLSDTHPVGPPPASKPVPPEKTLREDDTLPKRMGIPLASEIVEKIEFHPEPPPVPPRSIRPTGHGEGDLDDTLPRGATAHLTTGGSVADMWRPAAEETPAAAAAVSGMWTPSPAEIEASIGEARTREEIWKVALETFLVKLPRVVLLGCGKSAVTGWQGRGDAVTAEFVSSLRIPLSEDTVFASILASGVPHFGPLEQAQWPPELAERLGERAPDCAVFPIRILDGIAAFLYADRLGSPMHYEDFAIVARASAATANALSRFLLRRNTTAPVA
jgi:hypothetical protein